MEQFHRPTHAARPEPSPVFTSPSAANVKSEGRPSIRGVKGSSTKLLILLLIILGLAGAVGTAAYYVNRNNDLKKQVKTLSNPTVAAQQEQNQLISKIGALTVLPKGETPTIATVTDTSKLADQPFFANAIYGDKVLIYTQAKKAFLYRPSANKLINIAPVNLGSGQIPAATTPTTTTPTTKKTP